MVHCTGKGRCHTKQAPSLVDTSEMLLLSGCVSGNVVHKGTLCNKLNCAVKWCYKVCVILARLFFSRGRGPEMQCISEKGQGRMALSNYLFCKKLSSLLFLLAFDF